MLSTPVVLFIFNRPDLTRTVFEQIARAQPRQLFIVADGPRTNAELDLCTRTREIVDQVDWNCQLQIDFSDKNLGCGRRISSGLDWVFSEVNEAIILEDDTLPSDSFFTFCQVLLERYRDDERVMRISGNNFQFGQVRSNYSYHFSKYGACWGWATWRRTWQYYDHRLGLWPEFKRAGLLEQICTDPFELQFWIDIFDGMHADPPLSDTWDYQLEFACWSQGGLAAEPSVNLVSNIGFGREDASHTTGVNKIWQDYSIPEELGEIRHPPFVVQHKEADAYLFDYVIGGRKMKARSTLRGKIRRRLSPFRKLLSAMRMIPVQAAKT